MNTIVVNGARFKNIIVPLFDRAEEFLNQPANLMETAVSFVGREKMRELNKLYRGKDKPTDVLSFPMTETKAGERIDRQACLKDIDALTGRLFIGDIVLCLAVAKKQSIEYGHSVETEIKRLALHGLLHLLGYDHETDEASGEKMRLIEESVLSLD